MNEWVVPGFDEVRELGRGGQGRVVLALHAESRTPVAGQVPVQRRRGRPPGATAA